MLKGYHHPQQMTRPDPMSMGTDLSRFKNAKHFASWLGLCPGTKISGGKVLSGASRRTANRAAQALRLAAAALRSSQSALGAYYRRLCARLDRPKAITATAHKLARLIYTMLTKGRITTRSATASVSCTTSPGVPKNSASSSPRFLQSIKTIQIINQLKCVS